MNNREINKLRKQRNNITNQNYFKLTEAKKEKSWSRLTNIDYKLNKLNANK